VTYDEHNFPSAVST